MKTHEVPQDNGMIGDFGREVCYAVDENGEYTLASSLGWEAKNIVNSQAWKVIEDDISRALQQIDKNLQSPIAFYQARHQMDLSLLAQYVGMARWRVKRHLKPKVFNKLTETVLQRYCNVFEITLEDLKRIPSKYLPENLRLK